ncbi:cytochrome P450 [Melanomma pulvis-pyrius CBS 109.77]|uniref:Cytochrome P450 n=1 Tax=Melanomma pulvis-pyrius CBS 109.77 TaxID=1314802 RepID=A0A6A6XTB4_9PLEO|nr:cytochrome P450 [Melanomma pulvis-pyrius CBS 109.77]
MAFSFVSFFSSTPALVVGLVVAALVLLYHAALPKPIPGIPYNHESSKSVLGDIPSMNAYKKETQEIFTWMTAQCQKLNSPIVQVFVRPFSTPWVIITDARECQDVLLRRSREFDRSRFTTDVVQPILREHHFSFPSGPKQKAHRALLSDLMTPGFLHEIAAPQLYEATLDLLSLWRKKAVLARDHPFEAKEDISNVALDTIWAAAVGKQVGTTASQLDLLNHVPALQLPERVTSAVVFPQADYPSDVIAIRDVINTMGVGVSSPLPKVTYLFYKNLPSIKAAFQKKDLMLTRALRESQARLEKENDNDNNDSVKSAMDYILKREIVIAKKENRPLQLDRTVLQDELFGFLLAGHETTSTTMSWGIKFLADHQDVQKKLRQALQSGIPAAVAQRRQPTYHEIVNATIPYFEAVIEECLRCGGPAAVHARLSLVETELLGVRIPKGTDVFFMTNGPSFIAPPIPIEEGSRSKTCQSSKHKIGTWDSSRISQFDPERWLKIDNEGKLVINLQAGPNIPFGGGPRGCFGKKFAYLEMRTVFTIIFWNFELLPVAPKLSTYSAVDLVTHQPQQCFVRLAAYPS